MNHPINTFGDFPLETALFEDISGYLRTIAIPIGMFALTFLKLFLVISR